MGSDSVRDVTTLVSAPGNLSFGCPHVKGSSFQTGERGAIAREEGELERFSRCRAADVF